jgi:hypothetical protein
MFEQIVTPRSQPVITPERLAAFGRFDVPQKYQYGISPAVYTDDYQLLLDMISAASDEVENMAATACLNEQVLLTFDFFPGQADPRQEFLALSYAYATNLWWYGFPTLDSIELVRRPVVVPSGSPLINAVTVTYNDTNGVVQTLDPSTYTVFADKITLNVGLAWPLTDRRQDCIQIRYSCGYSATDPTEVPSRLIMAILYLANHMHDVRQIISVEPTSEVGMTLRRMLSSFRSMRIPR